MTTMIEQTRLLDSAGFAALYSHSDPDAPCMKLGAARCQANARTPRALSRGGQGPRHRRMSWDCRLVRYQRTVRDEARLKEGRRPKTSEPLSRGLAWGGDQRRRCQHVCLLCCRPMRTPQLFAVLCAAILLQVAALPPLAQTSVAAAPVSTVHAPLLRHSCATSLSPRRDRLRPKRVSALDRNA